MFLEKATAGVFGDAGGSECDVIGLVFDYEADTLVALSPTCCKDGVAAAIKEYFDYLSHVADDGGIHSKDLLSLQLTTRGCSQK